MQDINAYSLKLKMLKPERLYYTNK